MERLNVTDGAPSIMMEKKEMPCIRFIKAGEFKDYMDEDIGKKKFRLQIGTTHKNYNTGIVFESNLPAKKMVEYLREMANNLEKEYQGY